MWDTCRPLIIWWRRSPWWRDSRVIFKHWVKSSRRWWRRSRGRWGTYVRSKVAPILIVEIGVEEGIYPIIHIRYINLWRGGWDRSLGGWQSVWLWRTFMVSLLTVNSCIKVRLDLQADKSPVVVKGPFFPRVVNPRYRIRGTNVWRKRWSSKAK
jgi:hypothetical protein